jgi:hypothetical protein
VHRAACAGKGVFFCVVWILNAIIRGFFVVVVAMAFVRKELKKLHNASNLKHVEVS